jgi:hypothetical protein
MPATTLQVLRGLLLATQLAVLILVTSWVFGYLGGVSLRPVKAGFAAGSNDTNRSARPGVAWRVDRIMCLQLTQNACIDARVMPPGCSIGIPC